MWRLYIRLSGLPTGRGKEDHDWCRLHVHVHGTVQQYQNKSKDPTHQSTTTHHQSTIIANLFIAYGCYQTSRFSIISYNLMVKAPISLLFAIPRLDSLLKYSCTIRSYSHTKMKRKSVTDSDPDPLQSHKASLTFVTGNKKKLEEVQRILAVQGAPFEVTNRKIDLPELQGDDPAEIAIEKCKLAAVEVQGPVFTEDTSLCFNALNGMPGVYIKWFLQKCGHEGLNKMLDGFEDRSAYAQTVIAYTAGVGKEVHVFDGRTDGTIVRPRGPLDFGW
jgi:inosine triphosphate pyrophosphatase